jgi:CheY-like chemotaxis protein
MAVVEHPWGSEETWAATDLYAARTVVLRAGTTAGPFGKTHRDRSIRVQRGVVTAHVDGERVPRTLRAGESFHVRAGTGCSLRVTAEAEVVEVSADRARAEAALLATAAAPDGEIVIDDADVIEEAVPSLVSSLPRAPRPAVDRPGAPVVLVVEDDLLIQDILVRAFGASYTVYRADDGAQGLELVRALPRVDLVVTDLMMPRMSGIDLLRHVKADVAKSRIPIIMLTARATSADVAAAINAGARSYVTKPFKLKELVGQVDKIVATQKGA